MARPFLAVAAALALAGSAVPAMAGPSSLSSRLASDRIGVVRSGTYQAGDDLEFTLNRDGPHYLLRFADTPEVFVLYADHASMGGRVLKYDFGKTALQVTGWGGLTLYTDKKPGGLPVVRTGDATPPQLPVVSLDQLKQAASDESTHLAYARQLTVRFTTDWGSLENDPHGRALCFDAMENAARGLERFATGARGHRTVNRRIAVISLQTGDKPILRFADKTLTVTYNPRDGYVGRASSRAIALALGRLFHLPREER